MAPITFGSMTMAASVPKGLRTSNDTGIGFIQQMNSTFTAGKTEGAGQGPQSGTLTADVAKDFQGIRAGMTEQPQNRSLLGKIADFIVNAKINKAANPEQA